MIKFRPVKGGLEASMAELFEFDSLNELVTHLQEEWSYLIRPGELKFKPYFLHKDDRIGWEQTYLVSFQDFPIGYTDNIPMASK